MSKRRVVHFVVLGAAAITLAGYSVYAKRMNRAMAADQAVSFADPSDEPQSSNSATKTSRLMVPTSLTNRATQPTYSLASAQPDMEFGRPANPLIAATPAIPATAPAPVAEPKAAAAPAPLPHDKSTDKTKKLPPPPAPPAASGLLDDGQISGLKGRLRLTADQVGYWPAVESALRDVVRTQLRGNGKHALGGKINIDVNSAEVQKLIWAAMPLLMRLREDQKSEVRKLARVIGLEQVASQI